MIGVHLKLKKDFSIVRETLERIGIKNKNIKTFYPSCYCVECQHGDYKIVHFKELFPLFNRETNFNEQDRLRRNTIIMLLAKWGLIEVINKNDINDVLVDKINILSFEEKNKYSIVHKFKFNTKIIIE